MPGQASIYIAEQCAILLALDVVNNSNEDKYIICVDSLSCLQAIEQQHIDHPLVLDVLEKCSALINKTVLFCWVPSHVGIRGNELADAAAKAALNEELTIMTLPYSDFKPLVKRFIRGKWSDFWATQINNKLHSVQPTLGCGSLSNRDRRREQLVLCRLRLGHTYTTQVLTAWGGPTSLYLVSGEFDSGTHPDPLCGVFSCPIPMFWCQQRGRTISYSISRFNYTLYAKSWPLLFNII